MVSAGLLFVLYRTIDVRLVGLTLQQAHPGWLVLSVGFIAPLTLLRALRYAWIVPRAVRPGVSDAVRMTLVAGTFNMFMPVKSGDLVKSVAVAAHPEATASLAVASVVYERLADVFAVLLWGLIGMVASRTALALSPWAWMPVALVCAAAGAMLLSRAPMDRLIGLLSRCRVGGRTPHFIEAVVERTHGWPRLQTGLRGRRFWLLMLTTAIGFLQLLQVWLFAVTVQIDVPFAACIVVAAVVLLVGQFPLTFGGLGARDIALVVLLADYGPPESAAAMGLLAVTRGLLPAVAGLFVLKPHLAAVVDVVRNWRRG